MSGTPDIRRTNLNFLCNQHKNLHLVPGKEAARYAVPESRVIFCGSRSNPLGPAVLGLPRFLGRHRVRL